jgi:glycosyltransferase involved in cell wall biosynthesis
MIAKKNVPVFSIVIPIYNKEPHITRSINSVLKQTFKDFELIIVCDPSTDKSNEKVSKFSDSRIRVFHRDKPGPGGYAARNLGIRESHSEWIAFLDADDEWYPEHLEKLRALAEQFPRAGVMGCGYNIVSPEVVSSNRDKDSYHDNRSHWGNHFLDFQSYLKAEVEGLRPTWTSATCVRKCILEQSGAFPAGKANRGGDVDTWLRCVEKAKGVAWGKYIGAVYYCDSVNMVTKTAWSDAGHQRATIKNLLKKYDGRTAKLLKIHSNRRTISAWLHNSSLKSQKNFYLLGRLYLDVNPLNSLAWIFLSFAPSSVLKVLRKAKNAFRG